MSMPSSGSSTERSASITSSRVIADESSRGESSGDAAPQREDEPDGGRDDGQDEQPLDHLDREPDRDRDDHQRQQREPDHARRRANRAQKPSRRTSSRRSRAKKWIPSTKRTQLQRVHITSEWV